MLATSAEARLNRASRAPVLNEDPVLRPTEAADYIRVSRRTIDRMVASGMILTVSITASAKGIRKSELERFLREGPAARGRPERGRPKKARRAAGASAEGA